jgi:hypothetical protein
VFTARYVLPTIYLCVLCGSENKQRLFHCTALIDWLLQPRRSVYCAVRARLLIVFHDDLRS